MCSKMYRQLRQTTKTHSLDSLYVLKNGDTHHYLWSVNDRSDQGRSNELDLIDFSDSSYVQTDTLRVKMRSSAVDRVSSCSLRADWPDQRAAMRLITSCWPLVMWPLQPVDTDSDGHNNTHSKQAATSQCSPLCNSKTAKYKRLHTALMMQPPSSFITATATQIVFEVEIIERINESDPKPSTGWLYSVCPLNCDFRI